MWRDFALAHGSKTAVRAAVTPSPEPVSNVALSTGEDAAAIGLLWLVTAHPWAAAATAAVSLVFALVAVRWVVRMARGMFRKTQSTLARIG